MTTLSDEIHEATVAQNAITQELLQKQNSSMEQQQQQQQQERHQPVKLATRCNTSSCNSISQAYALRREYIAAMQNPAPGIYPLPSSLSPFTWFGLFFVRSGPYQGYIIRFTLHISKGFPDSTCPEVYLAPPHVFHPHVDPCSGHVDIARGFRSSAGGGSSGWQPHGNRVWHALHYLRRLFIRPDEFACATGPEQNFSNPDAAALMRQPDRGAFQRRLADGLAENLASSGEPPLPDDPSADAIWRAASPTGGAKFESARQRLVQIGCYEYSHWNKDSNLDNKDCAETETDATKNRCIGLSWMNRDSMRILSGGWL